MNDPLPPIGPIGTKSTTDTDMGGDTDHLRLLTIFHYVVAGLAALFAMFPLIHLAMGLFLVFCAKNFSGPGQTPPPVWFGWIFIIVARKGPPL